MRRPEAGWRRFKIGAFTATVVWDGAIAFESLASEFPGRSAGEVDVLTGPALSATSPGLSPLNCLLVDTGARRLLFDAGMGASPLLGRGAGLLTANLAAAGVSPEDIDAVLLTHLHCDHLWGLLGARGAPAFPNAEVFLPRAEYAFWMGEANAGRSAPIATNFASPHIAKIISTTSRSWL